MRPHSRQGLGTVGWAGAVAAMLLLVTALSTPTGQAEAQSSEHVVITQDDLDWSVSETGSMHWWGFGSQVSADPKCAPETMGGPVASIRFQLAFDLSADPPTLTGTLSGSGDWQSEAVGDPGYGQEWGSWSFSGPIVDGWARETEEGWAWGGNAELALDFAGVRLCSIFLNESGSEDYIFAEGNGQRQLTVRFVGGAEAYGGDSGFSLDGSSAPDWEPGEDAWGIALGCNGCDIPLSLPASPDAADSAEAGELPSGSDSGLGLPPWLSPGVLGGPPVGDASVSGAQSDQGETGGEGGWDPAGVVMLIMLVIFALLAVGPPLARSLKGRRTRGEVPGAVQAVVASVLTERWSLSPGEMPTAAEMAPQTAAQARVAVAHMARDPIEWPTGDQAVPFSVEDPFELRIVPGEGHPGIGVVLQPGGRYEIIGIRQFGDDPYVGRDNWYEVRVGDQVGWVPHSAMTLPFEQAAKPPPAQATPPPAPVLEEVLFEGQFETRDPRTGNVSRELPGAYRLGRPDANHYRSVYDAKGKLLGEVHESKVPTRSVQPTPPHPPPTSAP